MKKILYSIKNIIYAYIIQLLIISLSLILYIMLEQPTNIILTKKLLYYIYIGIIIAIIPTMIKQYKNNKIKENNIKINLILKMIPLGIAISLFYNSLTINLISNKNIINIPIIITIIYTSILGPIYEEIIFRYVSLNRTKKVYNKKIAILLISIIFAIIHQNLINIIYAFILGLLLSYIYLKHKNIIYPITIHIFANLTSIFIKNSNIYLLISSLVILLLYFSHQIYILYTKD